MSSVHKIRYGRFNMLVAADGGRYAARIELAVTREQIGKPVFGVSIDDAVMKAKLDVLRAERGEAPDFEAA